MAVKKKATSKKQSKPTESTSTPNKTVKVKHDVKGIRLALLKEFGANAVIEGKDLEKCTYGRISTGSLTLDLKLGGGIPIGKAVQISGNRSDGKSTLSDYIAKNAQITKVNWIYTKREVVKGREEVSETPMEVDGLTVGFLDLEGTKSIDWTGNVIGVDTDDWVYTQPGGAEEALEMAHSMQKAGVNLIVLDSIDALVPNKAYDAEFADSVQMGLKPKLLGEYLRKFTATNNKLVREGRLPCTLIMINQLREKIGSYGNPEFTPGGKAKDFYISIDIRLRRGEFLTDGKGEDKATVGQVIKFKIDKNKTYKQQQTGEFEFYWDDTLDGAHQMGSIDNFKEIVMLGIMYGVIERAGAWFKYKGDNIAQGAERTVEELSQNADLYHSIRSELFNLMEEEKQALEDKKNGKRK